MEYFRLYEKIKGRTPLGYGPGSGRWNFSNTPMIYCSSSVALTMVEHYSVSGNKVSGTSFVLAALTIAYNIPMIEAQDLPKDWNLRFHTKETQDFGTQWSIEKQFLCIKVPSVRLPLTSYPREHNLLINPMHPQFTQLVRSSSTEGIRFNLNLQKP